MWLCCVITLCYDVIWRRYVITSCEYVTLCEYVMLWRYGTTLCYGVMWQRYVTALAFCYDATWLFLQGSVRGMELDSEADILYTCSWDRTIIVCSTVYPDFRPISLFPFMPHRLHPFLCAHLLLESAHGKNISCTTDPDCNDCSLFKNGNRISTGFVRNKCVVHLIRFILGYHVNDQNFAALTVLEFITEQGYECVNKYYVHSCSG